MKLFIRCSVLSIFVSMGISQSTVAAEDIVIVGDLEPVSGYRADSAYAAPDIDFTSYHSVLIEPLSVNNVEIVQPDRVLIGQKQWQLTDKEREGLAAMYAKAMTKVFEKSQNWQLVDSRAEGVLVVKAELLELAPHAPKDDLHRPARSKILSEGAGSAKISVAIYDGASEQVLLKVIDGRQSSSQWGVNDSLSNRRDLRSLFNRWAYQLSSGLKS